MQPGGAFAEQPLHQLLHVGMLVQVKAITDLTLLNDEVLGLVRLDHSFRLEGEFGIPVNVEAVGLCYGYVVHDMLRCLAFEPASAGHASAEA